MINDQEGQGAVIFLGATTMRALAAIRPAEPGERAIFGLSASQVPRIIRARAAAPGLDRAGGDSLRVGTAQDLAAKGAELPALMVAGRWKSPAMPARYVRNEAAGRGAVARYLYGRS